MKMKEMMMLMMTMTMMDIFDNIRGYIIVPFQNSKDDIS